MKLFRCLDFKYDQFSNLVQQSKSYYPLVNGAPGATMATASESYQYDELQRMTQESRSYAGFTPNGSTRLGETYTYADNGNILSKTDFGQLYTYGDSTRPHGAGPHAVLPGRAASGARRPEGSASLEACSAGD